MLLILLPCSCSWKRERPPLRSLNGCLLHIQTRHEFIRRLLLILNLSFGLIGLIVPLLLHSFVRKQSAVIIGISCDILMFVMPFGALDLLFILFICYAVGI